MGLLGRNKAATATDGGVGERVEPAPRKRGQLGSIGTIFASGSAMFSDGYSNASIGPAVAVLSKRYGDTMKNGNNGQNKSLLGAMAFVGMVIGQLSFGYISDKVSRKKAMFACTAIIFVFTLLSACAAGSPQTTINCLIAFRFFNGIGIGGEYPSGSVAAAEATENPDVRKKWQQRLFIWSTCTMLDFAFSIAWFMALVCLWIFREDAAGVPRAAVWRGTIGLGIIPPLILLIARLFMGENEAYKRNSMRHTRIPYWLIIKRYWLKLLAVSIIWFLYNWIVYPFGMYAEAITEVAAPNATFYQSLGWGCLINAFYVPGTLVGSVLADWIGPKYCLITGLLLQAIIGFALSGAYERLVPNHIAGFAVMYGLFLAFGEVGPGNNLGLLASKAVGPTAARGQLYGIAAAIGKVGAFIGTYTFPHIQASFDNKGAYVSKTGLFYIGSALAVVSAIITVLFIPNIQPDAMVLEDALFREYLAANGYDVSKIGEPGYKEEETVLGAAHGTDSEDEKSKPSAKGVML